MNVPGDWKWHAALAGFALFTAFVLWLPEPPAQPAVTRAAPAPNPAATDSPAARPAPTPGEYDAMLHYWVQAGDTVAGIARLFNVSEENLRWANRLPEGGEFSRDEKIRLPPPDRGPVHP
jgi:hypothetical protein